jgi:cytochrome c-type biogenesis protein CcmH
VRAAQGTMAGKPLALIDKTLALDPKQPKALLLRGTHEIQSNDLVAAEKTFTLAKSVVEPATGFAQIADNALKDIAARRASGGASAMGAGAGASAGAGAVAGAGTAQGANANAATANAPALLNAKISLSADAAKAAASALSQAAVFVIVRAVDRDTGPPLAAKKLAPAALSSPIAITASDAMIGGEGLTAGNEVTVEARLSLSGQPLATAGDWKSARQRVKLGADGNISLTISERVE